jgi:hypothetical protein
MPHVIVKLRRGKSEEQAQQLADLKLEGERYNPDFA